MKVLFVVSALSFGGAETQIILLSRELSRRGHDVTIYTLNREVPRADELAGAEITLIADQKRQRLDLAVLARLRRYIASWRPDIVHGFLYDGDFYSRVASWGLRVPVLNSERSDAYKLRLIQRLGYDLTRMLCDGIVANSYAGAAFARRVHRLPEDRVWVVWNGIDLRAIDERLAGAPKPALEIFPGAGLKRVAMVASIRPAKDHALALRVMRRLVDADPSWRLTCVGDELAGADPGYKAQVLAERSRLQLEPFVQFVGRRRDVPEIVSSSDLLLVTSVNEGFPNAVLEAMACGTAVVSTDYSDVRRILPFPGQVVASRTAQDIADAVVRCYGRRAQLAKAQRRWVEQHATASASAAALLSVYGRYAAPAAMAPAAR
jgi:glycosyltransferase involved in cell wall biosynthesis